MYASHTITSFYGSSCAENGKGELNTPGTLIVTRVPLHGYTGLVGFTTGEGTARGFGGLGRATSGGPRCTTRAGVRGVGMFRGGYKGTYRSSLDAREPPNPTKSEEHQRHLQGVLCSTVHEGRKRPKRGCSQRCNTRDSQEQAPCATYGFLGLIQVSYEAPGIIRGRSERGLDAPELDVLTLCAGREAREGAHGGHGRGSRGGRELKALLQPRSPSRQPSS
eukprot:1186401-Prorocentrum_minimum.AAC.2